MTTHWNFKVPVLQNEKLGRAHAQQQKQKQFTKRDEHPGKPEPGEELEAQRQILYKALELYLYPSLWGHPHITGLSLYMSTLVLVSNKAFCMA